MMGAFECGFILGSLTGAIVVVVIWMGLNILFDKEGSAE